MRKYVAGFLFREMTQKLMQVKQVLLVRKNRPEWQAGLMNGIGGQIEGTETAREAMVREFHEEANYAPPMNDGWELFANERGPGYEVFFFRHTMDAQMDASYIAPSRNDSGEELEWVDVWPWPPQYPVIGNLNWLLPLALDPRSIQAYVDTQGDIKRLKTW
jgi:8-oxo-dGTP pyrophosphatase MutT (NUDIX family)